MSQQPISLSPDLSRLRDEGYEIEIVSGHLVLHSVPYVNAKKEVRRGALVSELTLAADVAQKPSTHVVRFAGEFPCNKHGQPLDKINAGTARQKISDDLVVEHSFSSKPGPDGYADYFEKMSTYVAILESQAQAIDPHATARTWRVIENDDPDSVFNYIDTASSRAGITAVMKKIEGQKIAIVGGGGTGSYTLDLVAKTPAAEIHVYDKDKYLQHSAFRSPGAPSLPHLKTIPSKVEHLKGIYSNMHRKIFAHDTYVDASNVECLRGMDFVFLCLDAGSAKRVIVEKLEEFGIPFVDVGMGVELVDDSLIGVLRVTTSTKAKRDHVRSKNRITFTGDGHENLYSRNIQIAELNALNAALAVIKWKKLVGFYVDLEREHFSTYTLDGNKLINEDQP
jgi:tRNA A37 threonylcarbamoyladenosine dehydratase